MALTAQGYFNCLKSYLNTHHYGEPQAKSDEIVLKEKVFGQSGTKPKEYKVTLKTTGEVLVIKLDTKKMARLRRCFTFSMTTPSLGLSAAISLSSICAKANCSSTVWNSSLRVFHTT